MEIPDRAIQFAAKSNGLRALGRLVSRLSPLPARRRSRWQRYLAAIVLVVLATMLSVLMSRWVSPANVVMIYLLTVVLAASYLGRGAAVIASVLGVMAFDFFVVPPHLTFAVADTQYLLTFFGLFGVGLVISQLTALLHEQLENVQRREQEVSILYLLSRELAVSGNLGEITRAIIANVSQNFGRQVIILLPQGESRLKSLGQSQEYHLDENEMKVAEWAYVQDQAGGRGTPFFADAQARYLPLKTGRGILGVMGVAPRDLQSPLKPEQRRVLESFASLAALAIERAQLEEAARDAQLLQATEKLQSALLNSISHDLRTPLVSITGVLSTLQDEGTELDLATRQTLIDTACEEADRLNRLVGNLLDMTRIEAGAIKVVWEPCDLQDLISTAVEQVDIRREQHPISIDVPQDLPLVALDFGLLVQVLTKLIDNAAKYAPVGTPIEVSARLSPETVELAVSDRGIGIPPEDLTRVFDKFYRVQRPASVGGTGMGLAICKGIIEAHGGQIHAENRPGGGTIMRISLPAREPGFGTREKMR